MSRYGPLVFFLSLAIAGCGEKRIANSPPAPKNVLVTSPFSEAELLNAGRLVEKSIQGRIPEVRDRKTSAHMIAPPIDRPFVSGRSPRFPRADLPGAAPEYSVRSYFQSGRPSPCVARGAARFQWCTVARGTSKRSIWSSAKNILS